MGDRAACQQGRHAELSHRAACQLGRHAELSDSTNAGIIADGPGLAFASGQADAVQDWRCGTILAPFGLQTSSLFADRALVRIQSR